MSRNTMIILILLVPLGIWLNLYAYYKYGRALIKRIPRKNSQLNKSVTKGKHKMIKSMAKGKSNIQTNKKR